MRLNVSFPEWFVSIVFQRDLDLVYYRDFDDLERARFRISRHIVVGHFLRFTAKVSNGSNGKFSAGFVLSTGRRCKWPVRISLSCLIVSPQRETGKAATARDSCPELLEFAAIQCRGLPIFATPPSIVRSCLNRSRLSRFPPSPPATGCLLDFSDILAYEADGRVLSINIHQPLEPHRRSRTESFLSIRFHRFLLHAVELDARDERIPDRWQWRSRSIFLICRSTSAETGRNFRRNDLKINSKLKEVTLCYIACCSANFFVFVVNPV